MTSAKRFTTGTTVRFTYTNYKGETSDRHVVVMDLMYGSTPHHSQIQWLLKCWDIDKGDYRTFAINDIHPDA